MSDVTHEMQKFIARLPEADMGPARSVLSPEYGPLDAVLSLTPGNILLALQRARAAREHAHSYRNFTVGAGLLGLSYARAEMRIITGANIKPDKESGINIHAEQLALERAHTLGVSAVSIVAVVGETQADQQSGREMPTLHPCGLCRSNLGNSPLISPEATVIVSALPSLQTLELYTLSELTAFHESGHSDGMTRIDLPDMELLRPVAASASPVVLRDTARAQTEDALWNETVGDFLATRRQQLLAA